MQSISPWFQTAKLINGIRKTFSQSAVSQAGTRHPREQDTAADRSLPADGSGKSEQNGG